MFFLINDLFKKKINIISTNLPNIDCFHGGLLNRIDAFLYLPFFHNKFSNNIFKKY